MAGSFLEFFETLQVKQAENAAKAIEEARIAPLEAARTAAVAAPSRPRQRALANDGAGPSNHGEHQLEGQQPLEDGAVGNAAISSALLDQIRDAANHIGPQLSSLRREQASSRREAYSMEHVRRLNMFKPTRSYKKPRQNQYCSKVHQQPCQYNCKTCHFCRQRTTEIKTVCNSCEGVNNFYGGPGRGYWCGSCLWLRVGENIEEVRDIPDWQCPGCRDICNCSGANCMRLKRGWFPTQQLSHEARDQGFASVAHYLVLTHVSATAAAAPIADNSAFVRPAPRQRPELAPEEVQPVKRQRTLDFSRHRTRLEALERSSQHKLQQQLAAVLAELLGPSILPSRLTAPLNLPGSIPAVQGTSLSDPLPGITTTAGGVLGVSGFSSPFLGYLDSDMFDDEEALEAGTGVSHSRGPSLRSIRRNNAATRASRGSGAGGNSIYNTFGQNVGFNVQQQQQQQVPGGQLVQRPGSGGLELMYSADFLPPRLPAVRRPAPVQQRQTVTGEANNERNTTSWHLQPGQLAEAQQQQPAQRQQVGEPRQPLDPERAQQLAQFLPTDDFTQVHAGVPGRDTGGVSGFLPSIREQGPGALFPTARHGQAGRAVIDYRETQPQRQYQRQEHHQHNGRVRKSAAEAAVGAIAAAEAEHQQITSRALESAPAPIGQAGTTPAANAGTLETTIPETTQTEIAEEADIQLPVRSTDTIGGNTASPEVDGTRRETALETEGGPQQEGLAAANESPDQEDLGPVLVVQRFPVDEVDELKWNQLYSKAVGVVQLVQMLHKRHPGCGNTRIDSRLEDDEADSIAYEQAREYAETQLQSILREAEAFLPESVPIPATLDTSGSPTSLFSHSGLRRASALLNYLAKLLPAADVQYRIERRLLDSEPFLDFSRSDPLARAIGIRGLFDLTETLMRKQGTGGERGLPIKDTAAGISERLAILAQDLCTALPHLDTMLANKDLPGQEFTIGAWRYDARAKQRPYVELFGELCALYKTLSELLLSSLLRVQALCHTLPPEGGINIQAAYFLTPALAEALLDPNKRIPKAIRRQALALVVKILDTVAPPDQSEPDFNLTGQQRQQRKAHIDHLCRVLHSHVLPNLETLVHQDYRMWHSTGSMPVQVLSPESEAAEHVGGEKVETWARCYGFLLEHDENVHWSSAEAKATQPYNYLVFWKQANAGYRRFAVFTLAHMLRCAPSVMTMQQYRTSALRLWIQTLLDTGGRQCASYLTNVLASHPATEALFDGVSDAQLDISGDRSGEGRARLLGAVTRNLAGNLEWRGFLGSVLTDLDEVLYARQREIVATAFNPTAALIQWENVAGKGLIAILSSFYPVVRSASGIVRSSNQPNMNNSIAFLGTLLKSLLQRLCVWCLRSCQSVYKAWEATKKAEQAAETGSINGLFDSSVDDGDTEQLYEELRTVADVRASVSTALFGQIPRVFELLVTAGAPAAFDTDPELLRSLWTLISGFIQLGSEAVKPTEVDTVVMEVLSKAIMVSPDLDSGLLTSTDHLNPPSSARIGPLVSYVTNHFVRYYLSRAGLKHFFNQKAAVNALRMLGAVLDQPCLRNEQAVKVVLEPLLRPMLDVLAPIGAGDAVPSLGTKYELYRLLGKIAEQHPHLLPPLHTTTNPLTRGMPAALPIFWTAVCRDALFCTAERVSAVPAKEQYCKAQLDNVLQSKSWGPLTISSPGTTGSAQANDIIPVLFVPRTPESVAEAVNGLFSALGVPKSFEAVAKLYEKGASALSFLVIGVASGIGGAPVIQSGITSGHQPALRHTSTYSASGLIAQSTQFRPGGFHWAVAEQAVRFITALAEIDSNSGGRGVLPPGGAGPQEGQESELPGPSNVAPALSTQQEQQAAVAAMVGSQVGLQWALACLPAVHCYVTLAGDSITKEVHAAYAALKGHLTEKIGAEVLMQGLPIPPPLPPRVAQEQRPPNAAGGDMGPPSALPINHIHTDQALYAGKRFPINTRFTITCWVYKPPVHRVLTKGTVAVPILELEVKDQHSSVKLMFIRSGNMTVQQLQAKLTSTEIDWSKAAESPVIVRFTGVSPGKAQYGIVVRDNGATVDLNPQTPMASALRDHISLVGDLPINPPAPQQQPEQHQQPQQHQSAPVQPAAPSVAHSIRHGFHSQTTKEQPWQAAHGAGGVRNDSAQGSQMGEVSMSSFGGLRGALPAGVFIKEEPETSSQFSRGKQTQYGSKQQQLGGKAGNLALQKGLVRLGSSQAGDSKGNKKAVLEEEAAAAKAAAREKQALIQKEGAFPERVQKAKNELVANMGFSREAVNAAMKSMQERYSTKSSSWSVAEFVAKTVEFLQ